MSKFLDRIIERAKSDKKTIVLAEGTELRTVKAASIILEKGIANIILLGNEDEIRALAAQGYDISGATIINPEKADNFEEFVSSFYEMRKAKGMTEEKAREIFAGTLSRSGVVLSENNIPEAMFGGEKPGGSFSYETVEGFGRLYEKLEAAVNRIADEMKKGVGGVHPVDDEHAGCGYCPGKRICKHPYAYQAKGWRGK